mmetsp:Transcript_92612/g.288181  ORF Transcript_92612/g.288181 Transcript_92612/m.288181 type:complete len:359 (+) Transcript_92612:97-1173(+)
MEALPLYRSLPKEQQVSLQKAIAERIRGIIGVHGDIAVLVEYISVMLQSDKHRDLIEQELEAFLQDQSRPFVQWLCQQLEAGATTGGCVHAEAEANAHETTAGVVAGVAGEAGSGCTAGAAGGAGARQTAGSARRSRSARRLGGANLLRRAMRDVRRPERHERPGRPQAKLVPRLSPTPGARARSTSPRPRLGPPGFVADAHSDSSADECCIVSDEDSYSDDSEQLPLIPAPAPPAPRPERAAVLLESPGTRGRAAAASAAAVAAALSAARSPAARRGGLPLPSFRAPPPRPRPARPWRPRCWLPTYCRRSRGTRPAWSPPPPRAAPPRALGAPPGTRPRPPGPTSRMARSRGWQRRC